MVSLTLLCCICPTGVVAYQFVRGGNDRIVFKEFLETVYQSLLFNFKNKKVVIILDSLSAHKTNRVKKVAFTTSMRLLFNLTHNSRSNPIEYFFGYLKQRLMDTPNQDYKKLSQNIVDILKGIKSETYPSFFRQAFKNSMLILKKEEEELK